MPCAEPITINGPCGLMQTRCRQCLQCRINKQKSLALRAIFEQRKTFGAEFWTLTYREEPEVGGWKDFSDFMKRLRVWQQRSGNPLPIRFLGCGEYGSKSGRFHYHALIFNGVKSTPQDMHSRLWPHGFVYIGTVTPASIRYTARYTLKFQEKGRESLATWSKCPPLGDAGMRELVRYMLRRGDRYRGPPGGLRIEKTWYPLDEAMKLSFLSEWTGKPVKFLRESGALTRSAAANLMYLIEKKVGDPVAAQRRAAENRSQFWESARFTYEKI